MSTAANNANPRTFVWAEAAQAPWLGAAVSRAGLTVVSAGSPNVGRAAEVAAAFGAVPRDSAAAIEPVGDLRAALATLDVDVAIIASPGEFGNGDRDADDLAAIESARARGVRIFSLEPMPGSLLQMDTPRLMAGGAEASEEPSLLEAAGIAIGNRDEGTSSRVLSEVQLSGQAAALETQGGWAAFCSPLRLAARVREAWELLEHFGPALTCVVECFGSPLHGTLGARVFDAADLIVSLMGQPETIDAAYVWPTRGRGVHPVPSDRLRGLDGNITANLRFADGRSGAIVASGRAGRWSRTVTLISEKGRLRIDDRGFEWIGLEGESVDITGGAGGVRVAGNARASEPNGDDAIDAVAEFLMRALDPRIGASIPTDYRAVLATTGAALLSVRTGEAESPATIARMARGA